MSLFGTASRPLPPPPWSVLRGYSQAQPPPPPQPQLSIQHRSASHSLTTLTLLLALTLLQARTTHLGERVMLSLVFQAYLVAGQTPRAASSPVVGNNALASLDRGLAAAHEDAHLRHVEQRVAALPVSLEEGQARLRSR